MVLSKISRLTITVLYVLLIGNILSAQPPPMEFGEVDKTDLEMTEYVNDKGAAAVVLCEFGEEVADLAGEVQGKQLFVPASPVVDNSPEGKIRSFCSTDELSKHLSTLF